MATDLPILNEYFHTGVSNMIRTDARYPIYTIDHYLQHPRDEFPQSPWTGMYIATIQERKEKNASQQNRVPQNILERIAFDLATFVEDWNKDIFFQLLGVLGVERMITFLRTISEEDFHVVFSELTPLEKKLLTHLLIETRFDEKYENTTAIKNLIMSRFNLKY